jgi:hypothetical protein
MGSMSSTYGAASMTAAPGTAMPLMERFGVSPILSVQGSSVPFARQLAAPTAAAAHAAHTTKNVVDRKADDWVLPRGRQL